LSSSKNQAYPIFDNTLFNISTAHPDIHFASEPTTSWTTRADKQEMLDMYSNFCPTVQKLLALVPKGEVCEWKLRVHGNLKTWVDGNVALVGDACHPTLPVRVAWFTTDKRTDCYSMQHLNQVSWSPCAQLAALFDETSS
jgi:hypothetical protein